MIDLAISSFDDWLRTVFDHAVAPADSEPWYSNDGGRVEASHPTTLLCHFRRFCVEIRDVAARFSRGQLDQGLRLLLSGGFGALGQHLSDRHIDLGVRTACLQAMVIPFTDFVAQLQPPIENGFYMWWHFVLRDAGWDKSVTTTDVEDKSLRDEAILALERILSIDSASCHACALHGLGHLWHSRRHAVVAAWIETHRDLIVAEGLDRAWLMKCRDGSVM